jgi:maltodextrin utilization protein YvdJ
MRNIILPILAVTLVLLGILFYLHPVGGSTTTTTTTNTTYTNTTWTNTSLPPQIQQLEKEIANLKLPIMFINQTQTTTTQTTSQTQTTTQTTSVQTSTTKVTSQQWYVQYAPEIVIAILLTLLGLLYKRRSKK